MTFPRGFPYLVPRHFFFAIFASLRDTSRRPIGKGLSARLGSFVPRPSDGPPFPPTQDTQTTACPAVTCANDFLRNGYPHSITDGHSPRQFHVFGNIAGTVMHPIAPGVKLRCGSRHGAQQVGRILDPRGTPSISRRYQPAVLVLGPASSDRLGRGRTPAISPITLTSSAPDGMTIFAF